MGCTVARQNTSPLSPSIIRDTLGRRWEGGKGGRGIMEERSGRKGTLGRRIKKKGMPATSCHRVCFEQNSSYEDIRAFFWMEVLVTLA